MATKTVTIGTKDFEIPIEGANPPWGEELTAFFVAIGEALSSVQGPNDILITSASLSNNQSVFSNIPGLVFNTGQVQGLEVDYLVVRVYDAGATTITEFGRMIGSYDGTTFSIAREFTGDTGMDFDALNTGQFQYKSSNLANHVSTEIRFRAKTIDQP